MIERETVEDDKGISSEANKKAWSMLLKAARWTLSNTVSEKSFQRDTEMRIKVLRYYEILQREGA